MALARAMGKNRSYLEHAKAIAKLGMPLVGSNMAYVIIGSTDTLMLGHYSVEALAAQTIAHSFFFLIFLAGSGFAWAVMPMVASHAEAGQITELRRVTRMGIWASVALGIAVMPLLLSGNTVMRWMGQEPELIPLSKAYLDIVAWGIFPGLLVMTLRSYLSALERTQVVMWVTVAVAVLNVGANWLLIYGNLGFPELGIRGAAIASLTVQVGSLVALAVYIRIVEPTHQLFRRVWRVDWAALARVLRLGWPISATTLAETTLFTASAIMMGWLGTLPLAAHGVAIQLASMAFVIHLGFSNAVTVHVGQFAERRDAEALRREGVASVGLSLFVSAVTIFVFVIFAEALSAIFIGPDEPQRDAVIAAAAGLLMIAAVFQTFDGLQVIGLGLLRGFQDANVPMIYATLAYGLIGLPASYILGFTLEYGGQGVWFGLVIGLAVAAVLLIGRYWRRVR